MKIHVPEDMGDSLKMFESDVYDATVKRVSVGEARSSGAPKCTIAWVISSEFSGKRPKGYESTVGNIVLDTYSLQEQALWRLNDTVVTLTGSRIPQGEFSKEEFEAWLKDNLVGLSGKLKVVREEDNRGRERMNVEEVLG
jgi:hypothetical protein